MAVLSKIRIAHERKDHVKYFGYNSSTNLLRLPIVLKLVLGLEGAPAGNWVNLVVSKTEAFF